MILAEHFLGNGPLHFQANNIPVLGYKIDLLSHAVKLFQLDR